MQEQPSQSDQEGQPVASLLEFYRSKRSAWIAEAESLAQLRDQVRSAADQETLEIVTRARQDVRDVIAVARQQLLVLTEQVRAALGDGEPLPRAIEALKDEKWLPATVSLSTAQVQDIRSGVARTGDWGADFDSLIREADDRSLQW